MTTAAVSFLFFGIGAFFAGELCVIGAVVPMDHWLLFLFPGTAFLVVSIPFIAYRVVIREG